MKMKTNEGPQQLCGPLFLSCIWPRFRRRAAGPHKKGLDLMWQHAMLLFGRQS